MYTRGQQTVAHGPNRACCLFLYGLLAKNVFYVLIWLKKIKRKKFVTRKNYLKFSVIVHK